MKNIIFIILVVFLVASCSKNKQDHQEFIPPSIVSLFNAKLKSDQIIFQIPDTLLNRDMLLLTRIAQAPTDFDAWLTAGSKSNEQLIYWEKQGAYILLRAKSSSSISAADDPLRIAVASNSLDPVINRFKIKRSLFDGQLHTIDVTALFANHRMLLSAWDTRLAKKYGLNQLDKDRSWIEQVQSFPKNIEIRCHKTYSTAKTPTHDATGTITLLMHHSFVLLPEIPMPARLYNPKLGWFTIEKRVYASDIAEVQERKYIRRWQLIPKDIEAYQCGELVEPIDPIVFYLDPATPIKWRPYFKKGAEAWNACFETAGFKNVIRVKEPPDSSNFYPEDIRYSVIRYVASTTRNASGPSVVDPRSGQILESDIIWYHNVLDFIRNRYLIETGATNPRADQLFLTDEVMGQLVSYVITHEVGHALGLSHNMKASSAYPVDSLRSHHFTGKFGITPTLMDYARFNYVAQPGDGVVEYIAKLGSFDHDAINWGYRFYAREPDTISSLSIANTPFPYRFSSEFIDFDPTTQREALGDDNIKASAYALKNLQVVIDRIPKWTNVKTADHQHLVRLHRNVLLMWYRYQRHVLVNIGGIYENIKHPGEQGAIYTHVERRTQRRAVRFLLAHAFAPQPWLTPDSIISRAYPQVGSGLVLAKQKRLLTELLHPKRLLRLIENEAINGANAYSIYELFDDLNQGLWQGSSQNKGIQRYYVDYLLYLAAGRDDKAGLYWQQAEIVPAAKAALAWIERQLQLGFHNKSVLDYWHAQDIYQRIKQGYTGTKNVISWQDKAIDGCYY